MKKLLLLFLLFSINLCFAQESEIEKLMNEGNEAYERHDWETAKDKYQSILILDRYNKNATFNLAAVALKLEKTDHACRLLYRSYNLADMEAYDLIEEHCGGFEYSEKMFIEHVDEIPKFRFRKEYKPIVTDKMEIHPDFVKLFETELKKIKKLDATKSGLIVIFNIDKNDELLIDIKGNLTKGEKKKIENALKKMTKYRSAVYKGKNVTLMGRGFYIPVISSEK